MPTVPARSTAQRADALAKANVIRSARALLKVALKARGVAALAELLRDPDSVARALVDGAPAGYVDTMRVSAALEATASIGHVKASRLLRQANVAPSKTVGGLSRRQRLELVALLAPMRRLRSAGPAPTREDGAA